MPTGAELDARAAALNGDGTAGLTPGEIDEVMDGFPAQVPALRIAEDELAEAIDGLPAQGAQSLAESIFARKEPRGTATIRGVPVEYTTLGPAQVGYVNDHCYRKVGKGAEAEQVPIYSELVPTVVIFACRAPGTDIPVFTMKHKAEVNGMAEATGIMTSVLELSGLTKPAKDAILGNSGAADTAA
jgi:hypothetical protein